MPFLQVKDERGEWQTVIEVMGLPAGKPKTIVVDLSGKFLSASREVRIVTNLCVYWDEIFLADETQAPAVRLTDVHAARADLRFRGFSEVVIDPERRQPERFVYASVRPNAMWNPTPGFYTRYGEVQPLASRTDDRFVIMGSGDELRLLFDANALPALPEPGGGGTSFCSWTAGPGTAMPTRPTRRRWDRCPTTACRSTLTRSRTATRRAASTSSTASTTTRARPCASSVR